MKLGVGGGDEAFEQGMGLVGLALEFRMELAGHEKRMTGKFDQFDQLAVGRSAAEEQSRPSRTLRDSGC